MALGAPAVSAEPLADSVITFKPETVNKNIPNPTTIEHSRVSITAPKGWTLVLDGPSEGRSADISFYATGDIKNEQNFCVLIVVAGPPIPMAEREIAMKKLGTIEQVDLNGQKWSLVKYDGKNEEGADARKWAAKATKDGVAFTVFGTALLNDMEGQENIEAILKSIHLK
jgi:hypothetical protein